MDIFDGPHFRFNKFLLTCVGQWPYHTVRRKYLSLIIMSMMTLPQMVAKMNGIIHSIHDIYFVLENLPLLLSDFAGTVKLLNIAFQTTKLKKILDRIKEDYASIDTEGELQIMKDNAEIGRKLAYAYAVSLAVGVLALMIPSIKPVFFTKVNDSSELKYIHHTDYFVDPVTYYYPVIFASYLLICAIAFLMIVGDTMVVVLLQHDCGLFAALGYRLSHLTDNDDPQEDINPHKKDDKSFANISLCVRKHQKAIEFTNILQSYFSTTFFIMAGVNVIAMSLSGFLVLASTDTIRFYQHASTSAISLVHIFFECVCGQRVIDHSARIHEYLIEVKWYDTSLRARQIVNFMLVRARVPSVLTGAGMFDISMETFSAVIRTAMSYFTVLRSTQ